MKRLQRVLGRRDTKLFLLLWLPVAAAWILYFQYTEIRKDARAELLTLFLAVVLGPGLILLGAASGVDRYHSLKRLGREQRLHREIWAILASALLGLTLLAGGIIGFWLVASSHPRVDWDTSRLLRYFYAPAEGLYAPHHLRHVNWEICRWISLPWPGWAVGYLVGRRRGNFLIAVAVSAAFAAAAGWILHCSGVLAVSRLANTEHILKVFSTALAIDLALILTGCILAVWLLRTWLGKKERSRRLWIGYSIATFLLAGVLFGYGSLLSGQLAPRPLPAREIIGLDPPTDQMLVRCWTGWWNTDFFGIDVSRGTADARSTSPQELPEISFMPRSTDFDLYVPSAPALILTTRDRTGSAQLICRNAEGVEEIKLTDGMRGFRARRLLTSGPAWYAWADEGYETSLEEDTDGKLKREYRGRLLLYCPETGERLEVITNPNRLTGPDSIWPHRPGYSWYGYYESGPEFVPITVDSSDGGTDLMGLLCDGFLSPDPSPLSDREIRARVITDLDLVIEGIGFEAFPPWSDYERYKIPAPAGNRGYIWEREEGTLQVFERGEAVGAQILDATGYNFPSWSPDGQYLAYASPDPDAEQTVVKLAFPEPRDILRLETLDRAFMHWSVGSDWLAIIKYGRPEYSGLVVVTFPKFEVKEISPGKFVPWAVQPLHDGSLVYLKDGKVFQWRLGWEEPVCVYDPDRETVLREERVGRSHEGRL